MDEQVILLYTIRAFKVARKATGAKNISLNMMALSALRILAFLVLFATDRLNVIGLGNESAPYFRAWASPWWRFSSPRPATSARRGS
jgi:hypothetical protein